MPKTARNTFFYERVPTSAPHFRGIMPLTYRIRRRRLQPHNEEVAMTCDLTDPIFTDETAARAISKNFAGRTALFAPTAAP